MMLILLVLLPLIPQCRAFGFGLSQGCGSQAPACQPTAPPPPPPQPSCPPQPCAPALPAAPPCLPCPPPLQLPSLPCPPPPPALSLPCAPPAPQPSGCCSCKRKKRSTPVAVSENGTSSYALCSNNNIRKIILKVNILL
ncbi:unnamed protein product [Litomosoides sigmodontis]|uniref:IGFBP N-terminal domain-containing protein n=1 Tax=Litomosoides sigmodontis TaxID=42156 RepID=A0A3P7KD22_LITSI|nr:unnamed protein product [Litomosoides sigmodontis]